MKSKRLITIITSCTIVGALIVPSSIGIHKTNNKILLSETQASSQNSMGNSYINIYNKVTSLVGKITFSSITKKITVSNLENSNSILGANSSNKFIQICLRKPNQIIPYKEVWLSGNSTMQQLQQELNNTTFAYGDLLTINYTSSQGKVTVNGSSQNDKTIQNYIIGQNGLENYNTNVKVNPIKIESNTKQKTINVTGICSPDAFVNVTINNEKYTGEANENGEFTIPVKIEGINKDTEINVSSYFGAAVTVKPDIIAVKKGYEFYVNPINVCNSNYSTIETVISGRAKPNSTILLSALKGMTTWAFGQGQANAQGYFSIPFNVSFGIQSNSTISVLSVNGSTEYNSTQFVAGVTNENPTLSINPVYIDDSSNIAVITGKAKPNQEVTITINNKNFTTTANSDGNYSVKTLPKNIFNINTQIYISAKENLDGTPSTIQKSVYPIKNSGYNNLKETNGGVKYTLNANLDYLTKPFNDNVYYAKQHLSPMVYKAWYTAFSEILKYNNTNHTYPINKNGYGVINVNYEKEGITGLTYSDIETIQNYLIQLPRMFLLRGWNFTPIYKNGQIVGENFYVKNNYASGDIYDQDLLKAEQTTDVILSTITPNMDIYQVIGDIESQFENSLTYFNNDKYTTSESIVGSLIQHNAVCGGYAQGLQYLLERVGVENIEIGGFSQKNGVLHEWNNVDLYNNWYLADPTWGQTYGARFWYLCGKEDPMMQGTHLVQNTYNGVPVITNNGISYNKVMAGTKYFNLMGTTNYKINSNNTITISYKDSTKLDKIVNINVNNGSKWNVKQMNNNGNGIWSVTLPYNKSGKTAFYFTVNNIYGTTGNVKINNLNTQLYLNGINAVTV